MESGDLGGARIHLEQAVEHDKYNYTALKLLAQIYMSLGMPAEAARRLEEILYFAPGDQGIVEMLAEARAAAGEPGAAAADDRRGFPAQPEAALVSDDEIAPEAVVGAGQVDFDVAIKMITAVSGVEGAMLTDAWGLVVASDLKFDADENLAGAMVTNVFRAVARSAEPLGIGAFQDGLIQGESGNIHIAELEDMILAVFTDPKVRMGMLEKTLRDFAETVLG
jgi:predicted regulator of Ras-like GTPase activity (Roadblock/LC7/MglB family)